MRYDITLKNYRCFPMDEPARFAISTGGATAFVGPNNAGKSGRYGSSMSSGTCSA